MKRFIFSLFISLIAAYASFAQENNNYYFPYPTVPDRITLLSERCNFLVTHFWEHCNFKTAFSSYPKMNGAVGDFLSFMPYATADTAHMAIESLLKRVKKNPKHTLALARMARGYLMSDTSDFSSEELYLPFAEAVAKNKKISSEDRAPFVKEARILSNSRVGAKVSDMTLTLADNSTTTLVQNTAPMILLFFTGPDCIDCSLDRLRLSADYALNKMIEQKKLKIINIYVGEDNDQWKRWAEEAPENWITGRWTEAAEYFDLSVFPTITYLNRSLKVLGKDFSADDIITSFQKHMMTH